MQTSTLDQPKSSAELLRRVSDSSPAQVSASLFSLPLFQDLDPRDLQVLSRHFGIYEAKAGAVLFQEGDTGSFMAVIVDGSVELVKQNEPGGPVKIATEGAGKTLGEMALIDGEPRSATAKFLKGGKILLLPKENFEAIMSEHPRLGITLLWRLCRVLSQRLRRTTGTLSGHLG